MTHILGHGRCQPLLLPEAVDDYVGADNPVRFIERLSTGWTSRRSGLLARFQSDGRPGYARADLLKLYIYRYLNRVRSSRRLKPRPIATSR